MSFKSSSKFTIEIQSASPYWIQAYLVEFEKRENERHVLRWLADIWQNDQSEKRYYEYICNIQQPNLRCPQWATWWTSSAIVFDFAFCFRVFDWPLHRPFNPPIRLSRQKHILSSRKNIAYKWKQNRCCKHFFLSYSFLFLFIADPKNMSVLIG